MIRVFVSYSRDDESLVAPIVRLLRVNTSYVFQDLDGIRPGKRWREEIARGIAESNLVVVFWCRHALMSASVSEEWTAAIEQKKDMLPLLLDATPLPKPLSEFQYIDFRGTVGDNHGPEPASTAVDSMPSASSPAGSTRALPAGAPKSPVRWFAFGGVAAALFVAVSMFVLWPLSRETAPELALPSPTAETSPSTAQPSQPPSIELPPRKPPAPKPSPPRPPQSASTWSPSLIGTLMAGLALVGGAVWYLRKKRGRSRGPGDHEIPPDLMPRPSSSWESTGSFVERQMASEIKAEIARRTNT